MANQIQLRNDTAANWTAANPILAQGEIGIELDTYAYKIGNGGTPWNSLPYKALTGEMQALLLGSQSTDPSSPAADKLTVFAKSVGGRQMLKWIGPSGLDTPVQPAIFSNSIQNISPGTTTAVSVFGMGAPTVVGTASHPTISAGSMRLSARRANVVSAATANAAAELRVATPQCYRGEVVTGKNVGGFFLSQRFACATTTALQRLAFGLFNTTAAIATTQSPSSLTSCIFAGWDSGDTNLQIMSNDASGTCTKVNLGSNFPANNTSAIYDVVFFAAPASNTVTWRVNRMDVDVPAVSGIIDTIANLPAMTALLSWHGYMNNGGTAAASSFDLMRMYLEIDV